MRDGHSCFRDCRGAALITPYDPYRENPRNTRATPDTRVSRPPAGRAIFLYVFPAGTGAILRGYNTLYSPSGAPHAHLGSRKRGGALYSIERSNPPNTGAVIPYLFLNVSE